MYFPCTLGLTLVSFGPPYSYTLLSILYGPKWANGEAPGVLSLYCLLILFLSLNGTSPGFRIPPLPTILPKFSLHLPLFSPHLISIRSQIYFLIFLAPIFLLIDSCFPIVKPSFYASLIFPHFPLFSPIFPRDLRGLPPLCQLSFRSEEIQLFPGSFLIGPPGTHPLPRQNSWHLRTHPLQLL